MTLNIQREGNDDDDDDDDGDADDNDDDVDDKDADEATLFNSAKSTLRSRWDCGHDDNAMRMRARYPRGRGNATTTKHIYCTRLEDCEESSVNYVGSSSTCVIPKTYVSLALHPKRYET